MHTRILLTLILALGFLFPSCRSSSKRSEYASGAKDSPSYSRADKKSVSRARGRSSVSPKKVPPRARLVIYSGELRITTPDVEAAAVKVRSVAESLGGRIQYTSRSRYSRGARIVVRVPVKKFYQAVEKLATLGTVTSRKINARDITREFQDTSARLASARRVRERLYVLMRSQQDVDERIKILREINRLTARIDGITARLNFLRNRASMSTITVLLSGRGAENLSAFGASPFAWIRSLHPARRGVQSIRLFEMKTPSGFFDFREKFLKGRSSHAFASPDGTRVRVGVLENYPRGNLKFWSKAVSLELGRRGYDVSRGKPIGGKTGGTLFECKTRDGFQVIHYSVYLMVSADHIQVIEVVYPSLAARKKHETSVRASLKSYKLRTDFMARFRRWIWLAP